MVSDILKITLKSWSEADEKGIASLENIPDTVRMLCIKILQEYNYLLFHKDIDETKEYNTQSTSLR